MFKINVKKSNFMLVTSKEDGKLTYLGYLPLIDLIKEQKRLGKNLFTGNVRGSLYKPTKSGGIPKPYYKDSLFKSIHKTITDIQKNPEGIRSGARGSCYSRRGGFVDDEKTC